MAASVKWYPTAQVSLMKDKALDWDSDTIRIVLHTSLHSATADKFYGDVTGELTTSGGYTQNNKAMGSLTATLSSQTMTLDAADTTWTALTPSSAFQYASIYTWSGASGTSPLWCYVDFGATQNPAGSDFTIVWNASGILTAVAA